MRGGVIQNYMGLVSQAATADARQNQRLVIGPWYHYALRGYSIDATRVGDVSYGASAAISVDHLQLSWFREHLSEGVPGQTASPVRIFVMGANLWRNENEWPLARTEYRDLFLTSSGEAAGRQDDGRLLSIAPEKDQSDTFRYDPTDPVPTVGGAHLLLSFLAVHGPADQRELEAREDVVTYTGDILPKRLR